MQYPQELRAKVVARALVGESTQDDLADEFGVSRSSIQNWMRRHRETGATRLTRKDKRPSVVDEGGAPGGATVYPRFG